MLFELITGGRPYGGEGSSAHELEQAATDIDPTRPSAAVTQSPIAEREGGTAPLARRLTGDLDTIVLQAIRKEPDRRYASVEQLSEDIRRHLDGFPVSARPDTFSYRAARFVSRHRTMVVAAVALIVAMIAGTAVSVHFALREREQRTVADARFEQVRELAMTFMTDVDGAIATDGKTAAREKIVSTSLAYLDDLAAEAGDDADVLGDVARGYFRVAMIQGDPKSPSLGDPEAALASARKGQQAAARLASVDPDGVASRLVEVEGHLLAGDLARHLDDAEAVIEQFEAALAARQRISESSPDSAMEPPRLDTVHFRLAYALERYTLNEPAIEHYLLAREIGEQLIDAHPDEPKLFQSQAVTAIALSQAYRLHGQPERALELLPPLRERLVDEAERHAELRPVLANLRYNLGWAYVNEGDGARGVQEISATVDFYRGLADADPEDTTAHRNTAAGLYDLGDLALGADRLESALQHYQEMLALRRHIASRSPDSALFRLELANALHVSADVLEQLRRPDEAARHFVEAGSILDALLAENPDSDSTRRRAASAHHRAGRIQLAQGNRTVARASFANGLDLVRGLSEPSDEDEAFAQELERSLRAL